MSNKKAKIFYSWQSDLSSNKTRRFIQECIDAAIGKLAYYVVSAERDNDTAGITGSPDIVHTIFAKIEECDFFVADVSIVGSYEKRVPNIPNQSAIAPRVQYTPNPNVLIEMGYAARLLGWNRVILLMNTDYGLPDKLPFDLGHLRITTYHFTERTRESEKERIASIITDNIHNHIDSIDHKKNNGHSFHIFGGFDLKQNSFMPNCIIPYNLRNGKWVQHYEQEKKLNAREIYQKIVSSSVGNSEEQSVEQICWSIIEDNGDETRKDELDTISDSEGVLKLSKHLEVDPEIADIGKKTNFSDEQQTTKVTISQGSKDIIKKCLKEYLDIGNIPDNFFELGDLKETIPLFRIPAFIDDPAARINGSEEEKQKYSWIEDLETDLVDLSLIDKMLKVMDNYLYIPFAIKNDSSIADDNISIEVSVDAKTATTVNPEEILGSSDLHGFGGYLHDQDVVENVFKLPENQEIAEKKYPISDIVFPRIHNNTFSIFERNSSDEDFIADLVDFVEKPDGNRYQFELKSLRPSETVWIGRGILVRPITDIISFHYTIYSEKLGQRLSGDVTYQVPGTSC
ncbi:hypothetical protein [Lactimicrobium massiliense]|uniref:hypothetical protein n=1 Tax=Lactimicrobium massiliense TaxID=2161814 RepID=UPI000D55FFCC|nr:hypothetical protein [Lactimicrobium massiliense]